MFVPSYNSQAMLSTTWWVLASLASLFTRVDRTARFVPAEELAQIASFELRLDHPAFFNVGLQSILACNVADRSIRDHEMVRHGHHRRTDPDGCASHLEGFGLDQAHAPEGQNAYGFGLDQVRPGKGKRQIDIGRGTRLVTFYGILL